MRSFVLDTNALLRAILQPQALTKLGRAIIELADEYQAELVVPSFALVEAQHELPRFGRGKTTPERFLEVVTSSGQVRIDPLGLDQVRLLPRLAGIRELHDRIIVAHALTNDAPLMTADVAIRESGVVETVW
ncbi:MAG: type II toxin-antitoxin system VapC family toxin [Chloroflexota bacterium]